MAVAVQQHEPQEQQHRPEIDMGLKKKAESFDELNSSVTGATQEDETADEQQRQQQQQQQQQQECSQSYSMPSTSLHLDSAWQQRVREYVATSMQGTSYMVVPTVLLADTKKDKPYVATDSLKCALFLSSDRSFP
ncbi:unnamed protein product [Gongylonema pulchrum]|uniref:Uncharacterized protein n=1 Tax=Gongylonema pulchrum TaxID=637853 RepID=A0A183E0S9_9BILA|nr:unnamed protein product [Gongylonema pulchrum]